MFGIEKVPDDASKLSERLQKVNTRDGFDKFRRDVQERREWIRARSQQIGGAVGFESPARLEAYARGPNALQALDDEGKRLDFELQFLDRVEQLAVTGAEELHIAETKKAMPGARKRLPAELAGVTAALGQLDAALSKVNASLAILGEYQVCGLDYPLSDDELTATLQAREALWKFRTISVLTPLLPSDEAQMRTRVREFPLMFEVRQAGPKGLFTHAIRTGPKMISALAQS